MTKPCNITHNHTYCPYGYSKLSDDHTGSLQYCGEFLNNTANLYFLGLGTRTYSPRIFRFNSRDSMSPFSLGGINSYSYCFNDPINLSDPTGHSPLLPRPKVIKFDTNWTLKTRPFYVKKQLRWSNSYIKPFESNDPTDKLRLTKSYKQQLHEPAPIGPSSRRPPVHIDVKADAFIRIPDSTKIPLRAYLRAANQHNVFKAQKVRHLPSDSLMTRDFIQNQGEARRLRTILFGIAKSTFDEFERNLLSEVLRVRL
ncbi:MULTISPECIES: RHS repeat-associated core domain-containing protein [Pseudomonas]|uniref:RHS repeat-associated core domain-containing protein n=1 Tax=Pseudomonas TaxID=286 RepID=UPI001EDF50C9|nr:RHS repeat-associated core domain-containing protein [Pseudomonas shirazica]